MHMVKQLSLLAVVIGAYSVFQITAMAAPAYTVTPRVISESLEARDIINREITITHTGGEPATLYPSVNNISLEDGQIQEFLPPAASDRTTSLSSWIEVSRAGIDLAPGETVRLPMTIRVQGDVKPGTYHAFIGFGYGRNRDEAEMQVQNGRAPGVVLTITIEDTTFSFLKIAQFVVDRFVTTAENQAAVYRFVNPGDETLVPTGEIILYDASGKEISSLPVNEEGIEVPPGGEHVFTASIPTDGFFGKYKALLSVEYGGSQRGSVQDTAFFYIIPLSQLLLIAGSLMVLAAVGAWYAHKKYLDDSFDDSERIMVRIKETPSDPAHHDIHLPRL
jgi:hypothetical protein